MRKSMKKCLSIVIIISFLQVTQYESGALLESNFNLFNLYQKLKLCLQDQKTKLKREGTSISVEIGDLENSSFFKSVLGSRNNFIPRALNPSILQIPRIDREGIDGRWCQNTYDVYVICNDVIVRHLRKNLRWVRSTYIPMNRLYLFR